MSAGAANDPASPRPGPGSGAALRRRSCCELCWLGLDLGSSASSWIFAGSNPPNRPAGLAAALNSRQPTLAGNGCTDPWRGKGLPRLSCKPLPGGKGKEVSYRNREDCKPFLVAIPPDRHPHLHPPTDRAHDSLEAPFLLERKEKAPLYITLKIVSQKQPQQHTHTHTQYRSQPPAQLYLFPLSPDDGSTKRRS